jgi:hypothetical protein
MAVCTTFVSYPDRCMKWQLYFLISLLFYILILFLFSDLTFRFWVREYTR